MAVFETTSPSSSFSYRRMAGWLIFGVPGATAYTDSPAESPLSPLNANLSTREGTAWTSQGDHQSRHRSYRIITSYAHPDSLPVVKRLTRLSKVTD
jgi:hypothetical protein